MPPSYGNRQRTGLSFLNVQFDESDEFVRCLGDEHRGIRVLDDPSDPFAERVDIVGVGHPQPAEGASSRELVELDGQTTDAIDVGMRCGTYRRSAAC